MIAELTKSEEDLEQERFQVLQAGTRDRSLALRADGQMLRVVAS